jgi:hypothetical protein
MIFIDYRSSVANLLYYNRASGHSIVRGLASRNLLADRGLT